MDWISVFTGNAAIISGVGILAAAAFTCWRAGSFHPINARLLRIFISKDDVEDQIIRKSLADQAALASFRMTHGVKVSTLEDAKNLAIFADRRNIPLDLIGRAGSAFDLKRHELIQKRVLTWRGLLLLLVALLLTLTAISVFAVAAASNGLLVSLKKTDTWLWLYQEEARAALPLMGRRGSLSTALCNPGQQEIEVPNAFKKQDLGILCDVWNDPALKDHLAKELPKQRQAFGLAIALLAWLSITIFLCLRSGFAAVELGKVLKEPTDDAAASA